MLTKFDRRHFLSYLSKLGLLAFMPSWVSAKDPKYFVAFTTHFSHSMTKTEWDDVKSRFSKSNIIKAHTELYKQMGWIIHEQSVFYGHCSRWEIVFKDHKTFKRWESEVLQQKHRSFSSLSFRYEALEKKLIA